MRIRVVLSQPVTAASTPPVLPAHRASPKLDAEDTLIGGAVVDNSDDDEPVPGPAKPKKGRAAKAAKKVADWSDEDEDDGPPRKGGAKAKGKAKARQQRERELEVAAASLKPEDDSDADSAPKPKGKKAKAKAAARQLVAHAAEESDHGSSASAPAARKKLTLAQLAATTLTEPELRKKLLECADVVERQAPEDADEWDAVILIDPGQLKVINDLLQKESRGRGRTETLAVNASA